MAFTAPIATTQVDVPHNTKGYSPYPQLDMAKVEAMLRAEAASRGLPYDASDLDDVNRNYSNSGGTTTSGNFDGAMNLVMNKYNQRISNQPNSADGSYQPYAGGNYNTNIGPERMNNVPGQPAGSSRGSSLSQELANRQVQRDSANGAYSPISYDYNNSDNDSGRVSIPTFGTDSATESRSELAPELRDIIESVRRGETGTSVSDSDFIESLRRNSPNAGTKSEKKADKPFWEADYTTNV